MKPIHVRNTIRSRAFATTACMACLLCISMVALATYSMSSVMSSTAGRSMQKIQATQMAEAGANALYAQIAAGFDSNPSNPSWPSTLASTSVSSALGGASSDGSYTAHVVNSPTGTLVNGKTVYTFVIEGDGVSPSGAVDSEVRTSFTETSSGTGGATYAFPEGAIVTNGSVAVNNGASTQDSVSGDNNAGIEANGPVSVYYGSTINGPVQVPSSEVAASQAQCYTATVTALSAPLSLPGSAQVSTWQSAWLSSAEEATTSHPTGNIQTSGSFNGTNTITVPAYYSGNFTINYGTDTLQPDTSANPPYVLYVNGNISVQGGATLINNGVIIVCTGTVNFANGTNYEVNTPGSSALIDLNSSSTAAVTLAGGTNAEIGLIYTPNGGITLNNGATYTGSLISGDSSGSISMAGGGKLIYPDNFASTVGFIPSAGSYTSSTTQSYFRML